MNPEEIKKLYAAVLKSEQQRRAKAAPSLPQGFTFRSYGRDGYIYYRSGDRVLEIYVEMSGVIEYDMLVWPQRLDKWVFPEACPLTIDERIDVRSQFSTWLRQQKIRTDYECDDCIGGEQ